MCTNVGYTRPISLLQYTAVGYTSSDIHLVYTMVGYTNNAVDVGCTTIGNKGFIALIVGYAVSVHTQLLGTLAVIWVFHTQLLGKLDVDPYHC